MAGSAGYLDKKLNNVMVDRSWVGVGGALVTPFLTDHVGEMLEIIPLEKFNLRISSVNVEDDCAQCLSVQ